MNAVAPKSIGEGANGGCLSGTTLLRQYGDRLRHGRLRGPGERHARPLHTTHGGELDARMLHQRGDILSIDGAHRGANRKLEPCVLLATPRRRRVRGEGCEVSLGWICIAHVWSDGLQSAQ